MTEHDRTCSRRRSTYRLLIVIALAVAAGRIAVVTRDGVTAFLSANDRSRWSTVASLVEHGTYVIDTQEQIVVNVRGRNQRPWATIDKVVHTGRDGLRHSYSSKPPLLPTLVAGLYAIVRPLTGMTLTDQPMYLTRVLLALVNLPLLGVFLWATIHSIERVASGDWVRRFLAFGACFGTMLLPFSVSLNNHLPAAAATAAVMWIYFVVAGCETDASGGNGRAVSPGWWFAAGLAAAFAVANELPALSMLAFWFVLFGLQSRRDALPARYMLSLVAGILVVAAAFFGTNWLAHQSFRPPYAHRGTGPVVAELPAAATPADLGSSLTAELERRDLEIAEIVESDEPGRWVVKTLGGKKWFALLPIEENAGPPRWQLAEWDDWYEYPGTHWKPENLTGVDRGEPSRGVYLFNMTIGHHGIFSLTPLWLLLPWGLLRGCLVGRANLHEQAAMRGFMVATAMTTAVCVLFYLARPEIDRNYGGVSVCFRWLLWFAPLWLLALVPAVERVAGRSSGRIVVQCLLAVSVFSVSTALASPWQHPWIYQFWAFLGWIDPR